VSAEKVEMEANLPASAAMERLRLGFTWATAALIGAVVLVSNSTLKEGFRAPKLWVLVVGLALLVGMGCPLVSSSSALRRARPALVALTPICLASILSSYFSSWPGVGWQASGLLILVCAAVVLWSVMPLRFGVVLQVLCGLAVIAAIWVLWDAATLRGAPSSLRSRFQIQASFGNPADAAIFLLIPCLLFQQRLRHRWSSSVASRVSSSPLARGAELCAAALVHLAVFVTQTLSGALALLVASAVFWWSPRLGSWRGRAALALTVLALGGLVWFSPLQSRLQDKAEDVARGDLNALVTGRLDGWMVAAELARERPWIGQGPGTFGLLYNRTKEQLLDRGVGFYRGHGPQSSFANAHNELLEVAAEMGMVGLAAAFWAGLCLLRASRRVALGQRRLVLAVAAGIATVSMSYFPFRTSATALPILIGVSWLFSTPPAADSAPFRRGGWRTLVGIVIGGVLAWGAFGVVAPAARAERSLWVAESRATEFESLAAPTTNAAWRRTRQSLERSFEQRPQDARLPLAIGSYWLLAKEHEEAERWYRRSLEIEVRPETLLNLSRALRGQERAAEAAAFEARLVRLDPYRRRTLLRDAPSRP
jgi:O-antigen ligase